jgi:hypothetical protein
VTNTTAHSARLPPKASASGHTFELGIHPDAPGREAGNNYPKGIRNMTTSKRDASEAARLLRNPKTPKPVRRVATLPRPPKRARANNPSGRGGPQCNAGGRSICSEGKGGTGKEIVALGSAQALKGAPEGPGRITFNPGPLAGAGAATPQPPLPAQPRIRKETAGWEFSSVLDSRRRRFLYGK